jgi:hypothetical protein
MRVTSLLRVGVMVAVVALFAAIPSVASAWTTGLTGSMTWTLPNTPSSFLGSVLAAGGSVSATSPAMINGDSTTYTFPLNAQGSYSPQQNEGTLGAQGGVTFSASQAGFPITVTDPEIDLNTPRKTGVLYADGTGVGGAFTAGGVTPNIINLDLSKMSVKQSVGQNVVSGITATIDTTGNPFPATFAAGSAIGTIGFTVRYPLAIEVQTPRARSITVNASPALNALKRTTPVTIKQASVVIATGAAARNGTLALKLKRGQRFQAAVYTMVLKGQPQPVLLQVSLPGNQYGT